MRDKYRAAHALTMLTSENNPSLGTHCITDTRGVLVFTFGCAGSTIEYDSSQTSTPVYKQR